MKTPQVETLQFMQQSLSRLVQSLFSLAVTLKQHVETTFFLPRARGGNYVDDIIIGKDTVDQGRGLKGGAMSVF